MGTENQMVEAPHQLAALEASAQWAIKSGHLMMSVNTCAILALCQAYRRSPKGGAEIG